MQTIDLDEIGDAVRTAIDGSPKRYHRMWMFTVRLSRSVHYLQETSKFDVRSKKSAELIDTLLESNSSSVSIRKRTVLDTDVIS